MSPEARYLFTVFTPTFNRAHVLARVYDSLAAQTFRDFEWLIVDDGSTDETPALVRGWMKIADFPVRYYLQDNKGKHVAINRGVQEAGGSLFLILDSDDACVPEALERFKFNWDAIPAEKRDLFSAVTGLCRDQNGKLVGTKFPGDVVDSDPLEMRYRYGVQGEKWGFQRTDILREHPFPSFEGERFMPEDVVWSAIGRRYKTRFVNEVLRVYWTRPSTEAAQDGRRSAVASARGYAFWHQTIINDEAAWFRYAPARFLRSAAHYARFSFHSRRGLGEQWKGLRTVLSRGLWLAGLAAGFLAYLADRREA
jgi:hypothetical protein